MDRIAAFLLLYFLAPCVHADVVYVCNSQRDYIEIASGYYGKMEPVAAQAERISASDVRLATVIVRECHLSSGTYVIAFAAPRTEVHPAGAEGGDRRVTVQIKHEMNLALPDTVMGKCDIPQSEDVVCRDVWAVEIRLSGRTGHVQLLRLVNY